MINKTISRIDQSLIRFLDRAKTTYYLDIIDPILFQSLREFCLRGGKRIRPLLFLLNYMGYGSSNRIPADVTDASLCIELLHDFMLVHDDIIDCSDLRRGKPAMHKLLSGINKQLNSDKLGTDLAIVAGDILYALAFDPLIKVKTKPKRKEKVLQQFIQITIATALGEFIDTIHGNDKLAHVKEAAALLNYTLKTSQYTFAGPMVMGATLAGAPKSEIKKLSEFGTLAGQSFQIQDDIIGMFDSEKNIGKSVLTDLEESKKTLLVCHASAYLKGKDKHSFEKIFGKKKVSMKDLKEIRALMIKAGSLRYCFEIIQGQTDRAFAILNKLAMRPPQKMAIKDIIFNLYKQTNRLATEYNIPICIRIAR